MAQELAHAVGDALSAALLARDAALLAVSGGTTPALFLPAIAALDLPWPRICVTVTDERAVPPDHPQSNIALLRRALLQGEAAHVQTIFPHFDLGLEHALANWISRLEQGPWPVDAMICGIGADAHIASLFPHAASLEDGDPHAVMAPEAGERLARWSLSPRAVMDARWAALAFSGQDKRDAWARAQSASVSEAPARLLADRGDVHVFDFT